MNQSAQSRFGDGETIGELQTDPIDGFDQIVIIDLPPLVARKRANESLMKATSEVVPRLDLQL